MSHTQPPAPSAAATITNVGPLRDWTAAWRAFCRDHSDCDMVGRRDCPLYCLPKRAIDHLAKAGVGNAPFLSAGVAQAERAFTTLCATHQATGSWREQPIRCPYLTAPIPRPDRSQLQAMMLTPAQQLSVQRLVQVSEETTLRLKGYVGWLLTEPTFRDCLQQLSQNWQTLADEQRPLFPLGRINRFPASLGSETISEQIVVFQQDLRAFLDRWGLTQLASWDLPEPQGPFLPNPLPSGSPALPSHGVHLVLPLHYPLQGDDHLLQQIFEFQRQAAQELGMDESLAGLPHFRAYASIFDVLHLERTIRSRLDCNPPPGFVILLEQTISTTMHCSLANVQKCRKAIKVCQRGQRSRVAWLRPRKR